MKHIVITLKNGERIDSGKRLHALKDHGDWSMFNEWIWTDEEYETGPFWNRKKATRKVKKEEFRFYIRTDDIKYLEVVE